MQVEGLVPDNVGYLNIWLLKSGSEGHCEAPEAWLLAILHALLVPQKAEESEKPTASEGPAAAPAAASGAAGSEEPKASAEQQSLERRGTEPKTWP